MKKKIFKLTIVASAIVAGSYLYQQKDNSFNNLAIQNIEALAEDEYYGDIFCYGLGSVDCYGDWVEMKIEDYRLR